MRTRLATAALSIALITALTAQPAAAVGLDKHSLDSLPEQAQQSASQKPAPVKEQKQAVESDTPTEIGATTDERPDSSVTVLGAVWDEGEAPRKVEYRTQIDGEWTPWTPFEIDDSAGPDFGTEEARNAKAGTEPLIVSDDEKAEVRTSGGEVEVSTVVAEATDESASVGGTVENAAFSGEASAQGAAVDGGLNYVSRKDWGANEKIVGKIATTKQNKALTLHHTAGKSAYSRSEVPGILRGIQNYHVKSRGWSDIGYNMLVDRFGTIYEGRRGGFNTGIVGAHASGVNTGTFGVAVLGTYSSRKVPTAVTNAVAKIAVWQGKRWGYNPTTSVKITSGGGGSSRFKPGTQVTLPRIFAHRDVGYTDCPGNSLYSKLGAIRAQAKKLWTPTYKTSGAIGTFYSKNKSKTGVPTQAMKCGLRDGGCFQKFKNGSVHWSKKSGAHFTRAGGTIQKKWGTGKWERGPLGYPTSEQVNFKYRSGAYYQNFQNGMIIHHKDTGTWILKGAIRTKWKALGWERGYSKLPISDEKCGLKNRGCFQKFEGSSIHWTSASGAHATKRGSAIQKAWKSQKYERGRLGYPTSEEFTWGKYVRQEFQGGYVLWSRSTKKTTIKYAR